jgi:hypothetical protein
MATRAITSRSQRGFLAAVLVAVAVAPFEVASFFKGEYPGWWIGLIVAPAAIALTFYRSTRTRLAAWLLLSLLAVFVSVTVDVVLWFS